jgi:hypothetical protein
MIAVAIVLLNDRCCEKSSFDGIMAFVTKQHGDSIVILKPFPST